MVMRRGDSRDPTCTVTNADGSAYDLTGAKIWFGAKSQHSLADGSAEIFKVSTTSGHIDVSGNVITIHILPADTVSMPNRDVRLYYEVQILTTGGKVYTVDSGHLTVLADVVKAVS